MTIIANIVQKTEMRPTMFGDRAIALNRFREHYFPTRDRTIENTMGTFERFSMKDVSPDPVPNQDEVMEYRTCDTRLSILRYRPCLVGQIVRIETMYNENPLDAQDRGKTCSVIVLGCPTNANRETRDFFLCQLLELQRILNLEYDDIPGKIISQWLGDKDACGVTACGVIDPFFVAAGRDLQVYVNLTRDERETDDGTDKIYTLWGRHYVVLGPDEVGRL
ncbi:hypothetical protein B0H10DRAFT_2214820 [Mycena sp. CBHHK59/15]|nr:hypothetical protein B0H10DRAFT_2214820 [Mycena sp. CBHHK59/15]